MENYGILLVDDEPAYHGIVTALLSRVGRPIDCVDNGIAAGEAVRSRRYGLILVDIEMQGRDGYQTVTDIRAVADWTGFVPIIAFTTLHPADGAQHFIDRGFDGWLPKPFQAADLLALASRWLGDPITIPADSRRGQLADLLGQEHADTMIDRMLDGFAKAVAEIDAGGDERPLGHRLGGLSGTLGFPVLSAAWLSLQDNGRTAWPTVRAMTIEAIDRLAAARPAVAADQSTR